MIVNQLWKMNDVNILTAIGASWLPSRSNQPKHLSPYIDKSAHGGILYNGNPYEQFIRNSGSFIRREIRHAHSLFMRISRGLSKLRWNYCMWDIVLVYHTASSSDLIKIIFRVSHAFVNFGVCCELRALSRRQSIMCVRCHKISCDKVCEAMWFSSRRMSFG